MMAAMPSSLPEPFQKGASYIGAGSSAASSPGLRWCCFGNGGSGYLRAPAWTAPSAFDPPPSEALASMPA